MEGKQLCLLEGVTYTFWKRTIIPVYYKVKWKFQEVPQTQATNQQTPIIHPTKIWIFTKPKALNFFAVGLVALEVCAHFYSAASPNNHTPDTDLMPSRNHIILTMDQL